MCYMFMYAVLSLNYINIISRIYMFLMIKLRPMGHADTFEQALLSESSDLPACIRRFFLSGVGGIFLRGVAALLRLLPDYISQAFIHCAFRDAREQANTKTRQSLR